MEYPQQAFFSFMLSILTAYALAGWVNKGMPRWVSILTGQWSNTGYGNYYREENGKPYNSGDPVAG